MRSSGGGSGSRVSIPDDLRETIQNIFEATGKQHSDEDIFSVFKDCLNDPHETIQRLQYLDTFEEVRSKRERKKENLVPDTQGRSRNGRRNFTSRYTDVNNGRSAAYKRQSGANHIIRGSRTSSPAPNNVFISPVNKGVTEEQPLSKSTSLSEDGVDLEKSKASVVQVAVPVSDSVVQNDSQFAVNGTSQISQQSSTFAKHDQVARSEAAANKSKSQSLLESNVAERPNVTFPVHLQVSKMLDNGLTFGSFDSNFVKVASSDYGVSARVDISTFCQDDISNPAPETELALQSDQTVHPIEGSEGDKLKEDFSPITDTHQTSSCDAPLISYPDQCFIAAYQQAMHLLKQQYPLNFSPYGPYFTPFCMPQPHIHQFLSPNGFQQQSYLLPGDDATAPPGDKLPLPHIKPGSNNGNSPLTEIPSPYDSYTAPTVNTTHKEEKNENIYSTGPLSVGNLQASAMYNLSLQGQPLAFPTVQVGFPGIYQQTQPILAAPTISTMTEPIGPPHITTQQPQAALTNLGNNYQVKKSP